MSPQALIDSDATWRAGSGQIKSAACRASLSTLYIRHVPDEVAAGLERLAAQAGLPLSTFELQELTESARRADNAELLNALASVPMDCATILEALAECRAER